MYNKEIYNLWELHIDATQHEISFRFLEKVIKLLSTNKLLDDQKKEITDIQTVSRWKQVSLIDTVNEYNQIINTRLEINNNEDIFFQVAIELANIIVCLRKNNIKVNLLEQNLEPRLFKVITSIFNYQQLSKFYNVLLQDLFNDVNFEIDTNVKLSLKIEDTTNIRNTVWNLENLCITFNEVAKWFRVNENLNLDEKKHLLNMMLLYFITNFFMRYINDLNGGIINYHRIYNTTIAFIKDILKDKKPFILIAFKSMALFMNLLVNKYNFEKNDSIITNYLSIINMYCNESNANKLKEIIFNNLTTL